MEKEATTETAGRAEMMRIEEWGEHLASVELYETYKRADELLSESQDAGLLARLRSCALRVMQILAARSERAGAETSIAGETWSAGREAEGEEAVEKAEGARGLESGGLESGEGWSWEGFSLREEVWRYEARMIEWALRDAKGVVSRAAQLLGFRHHHSLIAILKGRHRKLLHARSPIVPRRRSIIAISTAAQEERRRRGAARGASVDDERRVTILYAEDNGVVLEAVRDTLRLEGWRVDVCEEGESALRKIESDAAYDLLLVDNELPGVSGMELARRARALEHRRGMPVIMLSASDCGRAAREAGADAFLRKPEDILTLVETIARLLASRPRKE